jgi:hypothetical protein
VTSINQFTPQEEQSIISTEPFNSKILKLIKAVLESNFCTGTPEAMGNLLYGENSILSKILERYFSLICIDWVKEILGPIFNGTCDIPAVASSLSLQRPIDFERDLCYDLRSDKEDQLLNQNAFMRVLRAILEPAIGNFKNVPLEIK